MYHVSLTTACCEAGKDEWAVQRNGGASSRVAAARKVRMEAGPFVKAHHIHARERVIVCTWRAVIAARALGSWPIYVIKVGKAVAAD